jgi:hypothetical protein
MQSGPSGPKRLDPSHLVTDLPVMRTFEKPGESTPSSGVDLAYGTKVSFGAGGKSEPLKVSGWSGTEPPYTWTEGTSAVLAIRVSPTTGHVVLQMKLAGLTKYPELLFQPVEAYVNDQKIADWQVAKPAEFSAAIPQEITRRGGLLKITLKVPKAASPKELGLGADPRVLGVRCSGLRLVIHSKAVARDPAGRSSRRGSKP